MIEIHESLRALHSKVDWLQVNNGGSANGSGGRSLVPSQFGEESGAPIYEQLGILSDCLSSIVTAARNEDAASKKKEEEAKSKGILTIEQQVVVQQERDSLTARVADLSARNDRLMNEKENMLTSQHNALTMQAESSRRISELQQELEEARKDVSSYKSELNKSRDALDQIQSQAEATSSNYSKDSALLRQKEEQIARLEGELEKERHEASMAAVEARAAVAAAAASASMEPVVDHDSTHKEYSDTLDALRGEVVIREREVAEMKETIKNLTRELEESKKATKEAISLAEEAASESESLRGNIETMIQMRGTDGIDEDSNREIVTESVKSSDADGYIKEQLAESTRRMKDLEGDLEESQQAILEACVALANVGVKTGAGRDGKEGEGEAGLDRLKELVRQVGLLVESLTADAKGNTATTEGKETTSRPSPSVVKELMQLVYESMSESLEADESHRQLNEEGVVKFTRAEIIKRLKSVLKKISQNY